jgi:hypothetical protein
MKELASSVFLMSLENIPYRSGSITLPNTFAHYPSVITAFLLREDLRLSTKFAVYRAMGRANDGVKTSEWCFSNRRSFVRAS